jgi:hypothetical protein
MDIMVVPATTTLALPAISHGEDHLLLMVQLLHINQARCLQVVPVFRRRVPALAVLFLVPIQIHIVLLNSI